MQVAGITNAVAVIGGGFHTCARLADTTVQCWGEGDFGELGNGAMTTSPMAVTVTGTGATTWTSSNTGVATINASGLATAVSPGAATITATDGSGASASTTLTVAQRFTLSVVRQGLGSGGVTSSPVGITCGSACSAPYTAGTVVTLTATPAVGSVFTGWSGCDSVSGATCTLTVNATRSVTAGFAVQRLALTITKTGLGNGTVTSSPAGISCGTACSATYDYNTVVTLTATAALGSVFNGWSGCDAVSGATCSVAMRAVRSVSADFLGVTLPPPLQ